MLGMFEGILQRLGMLNYFHCTICMPPANPTDVGQSSVSTSSALGIYSRDAIEHIAGKSSADNRDGGCDVITSLDHYVPYCQK